jgi:ribosomal protein S18 acetylase RimI-like enzyme
MVKILPATLRDLGSLHRLEHACFIEDAWPLLDLVAVLIYPDVVRLKALNSEKMIGFIAADSRPSEGLAWIATLGVAPEYRRQGIAIALLRECESHITQPRIRLCVRPSNQAAKRLYEKAGYLEIDNWRKYYNDGENALVMEKLV